MRRIGKRAGTIAGWTVIVGVLVAVGASVFGITQGRMQPDRVALEGDVNVAVSASAEPDTHRFGERAALILTVLVNAQNVDPESVIPDVSEQDFSPYRFAAPMSKTESVDGSKVIFRYVVVLQCLERACLPNPPKEPTPPEVIGPAVPGPASGFASGPTPQPSGPSTRSFTFLSARISYRLREGSDATCDPKARPEKRNCTVYAWWPRLNVASNLAAIETELLRYPIFRPDPYLQSLPDASYRVPPMTFGWAFVALAATLFVSAAISLRFAFRHEDPPRSIAAPSLPSPLLVLRDASSPDAIPLPWIVGELETLASELEADDRHAFAERARRLAWSGTTPDQRALRAFLEDLLEALWSDAR